jgi:hypothetical protein
MLWRAEVAQASVWLNSEAFQERSGQSRLADKKWTTRSSHLDLALPVREKKYNKRGGRIMIQDFRRHYFGKNKRLTKKRCERFFSHDKNFLC